jgi:hypothetical protein
MKGPNAVALVKTMSTARMSNVQINGMSQYFFLVLRKRNNSFKNSISRVPFIKMYFLGLPQHIRDFVRSLRNGDYV